ncbi:MAG: DNA-directed RNA polymerase subunit beta' [Acidimicrobiales bacterium]|nr:MAG: DNA-directed RNA polymerase subunit beta' [Acidimicrobiales bacterium]
MAVVDVNEFSELRIGLATPETIRGWSNGEVKKPETINYRTLKPEKDGLFCEKIFGPTKDWECYCGKYKRVRFKGIICERCGVEVTRSKVRRERMGHIELAAPVVHIWYLRGTRSWLAYLLTGIDPREELKAKQLEKVIYFAANLVTWVDEERLHEDLPEIEKEVREERKEIEKERDLEINKRYEELERELAELEEAGAKESDLKARRRQADRDVEDIRLQYQEELDKLDQAFETLRGLHARQVIEDELLWRELKDRWGDYFEGGMGAEAIQKLIDRIDFDEEERRLREMINGNGGRPLAAQRKQKAIKRLKIVSAFNRRDENGRRINDPRAMILEVIPVIPPDLRPMVQLDGGRFATSDLNDLYRRVINRNNRLKRLLQLGAPEIIVNNERRMLQEAVDALFDNGRRGRPYTGPGNRPLKSLSDMLKGKQGRFRQNLLGKRVDYSGRSVIVIGPTLKLHQCGLPKLMALELFKPFVMKALVDRELAQNIKSAKRMVERRRPQVWDVLEDVIKEHPVLLNRAPTLHRLGIQAFEPVLVEGKAIQIHPLVCHAFNADFDGDQMAVHVPISAEAQAESRILMLSANNILSPADGRPLVTPTQDMVIGAYYLTEMIGEVDQENPRLFRRPGDDGPPLRVRVFSSVSEVELAYDRGRCVHATAGADPEARRSALRLHDPIELRIPELRRDTEDGRVVYELTTPGRVFFNECLPDDFGFVNSVVRKRDLGQIVERLSRNYGKAQVAETLDRIKELTFHYATVSGLTISLDDIKVPPEKVRILDRYEEEAEKVERQFHRGIITDGERRQKEVEIWTVATDEVRAAMERVLKEDRFNPLDMMVGSGARGNMMQLRQIAGMRGLVANPRGDMIPRPIKSNFREGLSMLEYFISTPGARKGLVDTALRTADSGYLTRRLVDVAQELIIRPDDPEIDDAATRSIWIARVRPDGWYDRSGKPASPSVPGARYERTYLETRLLSRILAEEVRTSDGTVYPEGTEVTREIMEHLRDDPAIERVRVYSPLADDSPRGISRKAYGGALASGGLVEVGEAVGVIAAQSIGEPGTQLTMRTFHTGGVAGAGDIAGGLPRVVELFEARSPKGKAVLARSSGVVRIEEDESGRFRKVTIVDDEGNEDTYTIPSAARLEVRDGDEIRAGDALVEGPRDPAELLEIKGIRAAQQYLVEEVQKVYRQQGVSIHDKHIELIVRQMTRRVTIEDPGDSEFLPGERVDRWVFQERNRKLTAEGKTPAKGRPEILGITKASLATDSWLSAASFQETTRVLTEAAIEARSDSLVGLKENIIIGKLIPAGTGMERYRQIEPHAPDYRPMEFYSTLEEGRDLAAWLAGRTSFSDSGGDGSGEDVVRLGGGDGEVGGLGSEHDEGMVG